MPDTNQPETGPQTIRVAEISARSQTSFEDAAVMAIDSTGNDVRSLVVSAWVKEQSVEFDGGKTWFRVSVLISVMTPAGKPLML